MVEKSSAAKMAGELVNAVLNEEGRIGAWTHATLDPSFTVEDTDHVGLRAHIQDRQDANKYMIARRA